MRLFVFSMLWCVACLPSAPAGADLHAARVTTPIPATAPLGELIDSALAAGHSLAVERARRSLDGESAVLTARRVLDEDVATRQWISLVTTSRVIRDSHHFHPCAGEGDAWCLVTDVVVDVAEGDHAAPLLRTEANIHLLASARGLRQQMQVAFDSGEAPPSLSREAAALLRRLTAANADSAWVEAGGGGALQPSRPRPARSYVASARGMALSTRYSAWLARAIAEVDDGDLGWRDEPAADPRLRRITAELRMPQEQLVDAYLQAFSSGWSLGRGLSVDRRSARHAGTPIPDYRPFYLPWFLANGRDGGAATAATFSQYGVGGTAPYVVAIPADDAVYAGVVVSSPVPSSLFGALREASVVRDVDSSQAGRVRTRIFPMLEAAIDGASGIAAIPLVTPDPDGYVECVALRQPYPCDWLAFSALHAHDWRVTSTLLGATAAARAGNDRAHPTQPFDLSRWRLAGGAMARMPDGLFTRSMQRHIDELDRSRLSAGGPPLLKFPRKIALLGDVARASGDGGLVFSVTIQIGADSPAPWWSLPLNVTGGAQ